MTGRVDPVAGLSAVDEKIERTPDRAQRRMLELLRERLVGELLGDTERVFATLAPGFTLVTRIAGTPGSSVGAGAFRAMTAQAATAGVLVWCEWDHLVVDGDGLVAEGVLNTVRPGGEPGGRVRVRTAVVILVAYADGLMPRETLYMDPTAAEVTPLAPEEVPDVASLAAALGVTVPG